MKLVSLASGNSVWRGLDYAKNKKVLSYKKLSDYEYKARVKGSTKNYDVFMNIEHPRKSKCNCPHAKDRRVICKHIVALYFTVFPNEVDNFLKEVEQAEKEYQDYEDKLHEKAIRYVYSMSKKELQEYLIDVLETAPEWVYQRFIRDKVGFD